MHAKDKALTRSTILGKTDRELSADPTVYTVLSFGLVKAREKGSYLEGSQEDLFLFIFFFFFFFCSLR